MNIQLSRTISLLLTGLIAGTFLFGALNILPTFYEVPSEIHLRFRTALMPRNAVFAMSLVLLAIVALGFYTWQARKVRIVWIWCLISLLFTIISLVITRLGSVPINLQMKTWNPSAPPEDWLKTLATWDFYNTIRTITSVGSFICLLAADWWLINLLKDGKENIVE